MMTILAVTEFIGVEFRKTSFEVITRARRLADEMNGQVVALAIGSGVSDKARHLAEYGADTVLAADDTKLTNYQADFYKQVVVAAAKTVSAGIILFSATAAGKDLAPRVAAILDAGLASDCTGLRVSGTILEIERPLYAGKVFARATLTAMPQVISLRPNVFEIVKTNAGATAVVVQVPVPELPTKVVIKEIRKSGGEKISVTDADIIVTGGRGVRAPENFTLIEQLAGVLNAAVGATRAVVDNGWRPYAEQVGQTGKVVSPNLYILVGASGSIQHFAGMSGSRCIVGINKDPNAPVFAKADYGIVGDLFEVVPALIEEIKKVRG